MDRFKNLRFEEKEGVGFLTINRPEIRNALTEETKAEMISALGEISGSDTVRALLISGEGNAFCAGGDLKNIGKELTEEEIGAVMGRSQELLYAFLSLEKPVVAAVNGDAFGMGCMLSLTADFTVASDRSRFSLAFVHLGLCPDFGSLYFLPRLIGMWKSKEMAYLGRTMNAAEALDMGLVWKVVPHDALLEEVRELATRLSRMPTLAIGRMKRVISRTYEMSLGEILREEVRAQIDLTRTSDHREGIQAFLEKRKPHFHGK